MTEETRKALLHELDMLRNKPDIYFRKRSMQPFDYYEDVKGDLLDVVKNHELLIGLASYDFPILPKYVSDFIEDLTKDKKAQNIFDPCVGLSSPINRLVIGSKKGNVWSSDDKKLIDLIHFNDYQQSEPIAGLDLYDQTFDLICSHPPFIPERKTEIINNKNISDSWTNILVLKACNKLSKNGIGLFVLPKPFLKTPILENLNHFGFFVNSVFDLPLEVFASYNSVQSNIVLISRVNTVNVFAAEITINENNNKVVAENYKNKKEGKLASLGVFVLLNKFYSIQKLTKEKYINESIERIGFSITSLFDIASIKKIKTDNRAKVLHTINSIYLPIIGNTPVVLNPEEMNIKPHNYLQIELDE